MHAGNSACAAVRVYGIQLKALTQGVVLSSNPIA